MGCGICVPTFREALRTAPFGAMLSPSASNRLLIYGFPTSNSSRSPIVPRHQWERTLLFEGNAEDCVRVYPRNVNVAVGLGLAAERPVQVQLWADPAVNSNHHEIVTAGDFGEATISIRNLPSPDNPSTSYLAALSIITLLKNLDRPLVIGT